jgi:hypothetical protein
VFATAGGIDVNNIARWDGAAWHSLGNGITGGELTSGVCALAVDVRGNLYVGGRFNEAGDARADDIAHWDGSAWQPVGDGLGEGLDYYVDALAVDRQGKLYAGGRFDIAGAIRANKIARWDDAAWHPLGSGVAGDEGENYLTGVSALALDGQGGLYTGGVFTTAGGIGANHIAYWDGTTWQALGEGVNGKIHALVFDGRGNLYAGGAFTTAGGVNANHIARWDGMAWSPLEEGMDGSVYSLAVDDQGNLYAGGDFTNAGTVNAYYIARWDGGAWHALGSGMNDQVYSLAADAQGNLYAGGMFTTAGSVSAKHIARWDGMVWNSLGEGVDGGEFYSNIYTLAVGDQENLYAAGYFTTAGRVNAMNIALWDGTEWRSLGSGISGDDQSRVFALAMDDQGNLFAGGGFTSAGGKPSNYIARWIQEIQPLFLPLISRH